MIREREQKIIDSLPEERRLFMEKQKTAFTDMEGDYVYFMSSDGYCWKCKHDDIKYELENGNDGSKGVTGCSSCHSSYCD